MLSAMSPMRPRGTGSLAQAGNLVPYAHPLRTPTLGSRRTCRCAPVVVPVSDTCRQQERLTASL